MASEASPPSHPFWNRRSKLLIQAERVLHKLLGRKDFARSRIAERAVPNDEPNLLSRYRSRLKQSQFEFYRYDAHNAFMNEARPEVLNAASAKTAWQRTLKFLTKVLAQQTSSQLITARHSAKSCRAVVSLQQNIRSVAFRWVETLRRHGVNTGRQDSMQ